MEQGIILEPQLGAHNEKQSKQNASAAQQAIAQLRKELQKPEMDSRSMWKTLERAPSLAAFEAVLYRKAESASTRYDTAGSTVARIL